MWAFLTSLPFIIILIVILLGWLRVLNEYERGVLFRLGRTVGKPVGPGLIVLLFPPLIDKMVRVDLRTITLDVPAQDAITRDSVTVKLNAVVYYRVLDPQKAVVEVENYGYATLQKAQTTLRSTIGQCSLDELLSQRESLNLKLQEHLDRETDPWGIKVSAVEIKDVDLPQSMQRAMAKEGEAERERRAKVINADGEFQAAEKLVQAADLMSAHPMAMQMRYLQTAVEISSEKNTTLLFPIPIDLVSGLSNLTSTQKPQG